MKPFLASALALLCLPLLAQSPSTTTTSTTTTTDTSSTPPPQAGPGSMMDQVTSVLSPAEKAQLMDTRTKAMTANPALQAEEMDLMQKGMSLQSGASTDADKMAFRQQVEDHAAKVRAAMIQVDPTIQPILQKIEAQMEKLRAQYSSQ